MQTSSDRSQVFAVPALLMAGGQSHRMRVSAGIHKALATVNGKPLLEHSLHALLSQGLREVTVALGATRCDDLISFLSTRGAEMANAAGASLRWITESIPLGTIGAARLVIENSPAILVVNVDNMCEIKLPALVDHHFEKDAALTIASHVETFRIPFGELVVEDDIVTRYLEKPDLPVRISSGTYVLGPQAARLIEFDRAVDITQLYSTVRQHGLRVSAYLHQERWIDINDIQALERARVLFATGFFAEGAIK